MKYQILKTKAIKKKLILFGLVSLIDLGVAATLFAQTKKEKSIKKEITIDENSGEKKMTITTTENGKTTVEEYIGDDVENQLNNTSKKNQLKRKVIVIDEQDSLNVELENFISDEEVNKLVKEILQKFESEHSSDDEKSEKVIVKKVVINEKSEDCTDKKEIKQEVKIKMYPNPSIGIFNLDFDLGTDKKIDISITDIEGKEVFNQSVKGNSSYSLPIDISKQTKGSYFLNLTQGKNKIVETIILK